MKSEMNFSKQVVKCNGQCTFPLCIHQYEIYMSSSTVYQPILYLKQTLNAYRIKKRHIVVPFDSN